eukprot:CAMPEP_0119052568 /NCGR_PEP_ID=MMETSP1177-20130426/73823_1 /TAXON_ID=2985 /ORGANISM="Ochromonas sp, Strain CCMP1899" /LENGTH=250 /DNA_ID=CAMNT_0007032187 /DNA_START=1184 /DNA_END=1937 /DNA_ORIENTATION=+
MESENEFTYDDTFAAPENTTDNMAILRSAAMQQQSTPPVPVQSLERLSDAQRYNKFCLEAGFSGNSADFYTWLEKQTPSGPQSSSVPPVPISDTPANYSGKITVSRLVTAGVVSAVFVTAKLVCGFNKSIFLAAALYELYAVPPVPISDTPANYLSLGNINVTTAVTPPFKAGFIDTVAKIVGVSSSAVVITSITATQSAEVLVRYNIASTSTFDQIVKAVNSAISGGSFTNDICRVIQRNDIIANRNST